MDLKKFREEGYLQEANRRFFHPLGLALAVVEEELTGTRYLMVQDHRDDLEGVIFGDGEDAAEWGKYDKVQREWEKRGAMRREALGYEIQPPEVP